MEEKIKKIIAEQLELPVADIKEQDSFFRDLGADSLEKVEIVMSVEKEYGVRLSEEEFSGIQTVGDLCRLIEQKR